MERLFLIGSLSLSLSLSEAFSIVGKPRKMAENQGNQSAPFSPSKKKKEKKTGMKRACWNRCASSQ